MLRSYDGHAEARAGDVKAEEEGCSPDPQDNGYRLGDRQLGLQVGGNPIAADRLGPEEMEVVVRHAVGAARRSSERVSALFPALEFTLNFCEPNIGIKGRLVMREGEVRDYAEEACSSRPARPTRTSWCRSYRQPGTVRPATSAARDEHRMYARPHDRTVPARGLL